MGYNTTKVPKCWRLTIEPQTEATIDIEGIALFVLIDNNLNASSVQVTFNRDDEATYSLAGNSVITFTDDIHVTSITLGNATSSAKLDVQIIAGVVKK
jgi:hypothetical protein